MCVVCRDEKQVGEMCRALKLSINSDVAEGLDDSRNHPPPPFRILLSPSGLLVIETLYQSTMESSVSMVS